MALAMSSSCRLAGALAPADRSIDRHNSSMKRTSSSLSQDGHLLGMAVSSDSSPMSDGGTPAPVLSMLEMSLLEEPLKEKGSWYRKHEGETWKLSLTIKGLSYVWKTGRLTPLEIRGRGDSRFQVIIPCYRLPWEVGSFLCWGDSSRGSGTTCHGCPTGITVW